MKKQISKQAKKASKLAKAENLKKKQAQIIAVKNAEGDPDTTAEILIQNQIDYTPKVSVIIPVYNVEQYLRECLDSVVNQTLKEIEIICVDDGSTDSSLEILKEYAKKDKRMTVIRQDNSGSGHARNAGLTVADGEFIAFMDSDDMYPSDKTLEHLYTAAIKNKVFICGGSLNQLRDGTLVTDVSKFEKGYTFEKDGTIEYKDYQFDFGYWRFIYNRQFLEENKLCFPDYLRYQDPPFFIKTMVLAQKFYALKEATYVYRVSYKKVHWNERKALDFFKGARDCLFFANEYSLFDLCYLLTTRLNGSISKELFKKYTDVAEIHSVISEITDYTDYRRLPLNTVDEDIKKYAVKRKINEVPCISIIIPCYKVEKYLRQCLNSVLKQTLKNIEIICINDGSPDNSLSIMREYAAIDKRIVIIDQENQGLSCARNNAISIAKGEYMWYVDSDDWIRKDACEILYKKAKENSLDVLNLARVNYDDETGKYKQLRWQKMDYVNSDKEIFSKDEVDGFIENIPISAVGYLYRRQFISDHDILFPEKLLFEDNYFLRKSLIFVRRFGIESKVLYFKRTHAGAITRNIANFFADYIKIVYMISTLYQDNHLDLNVVKKIINSYCKNLYSIFSYFSPSDKKKYQCDFFNFLYTMDRLYKLDFNLSSKIEKEIVVTYKNVCHSNLNIKDPQNYNEKIQWLKLYDSTPIKTRLADKYLVRDWIKEKIGEEYLIPLLGVYDRFEEINFDKLPKQFVIKCNHGCGYNIIVKDKSQLDLIETKANLDKWMKENFAFKAGFEMHYRDIKPKIIIEKFIENKGTNDLYDYKFWCFNGKVEYIQFLSERNLDGLKMAFYDRNWVKQDFVYSYPLDKKNMPRPDNLDLMITLVEKLAQDFSHVRVDFYRLNDGKLYFGEMTFTSASGTCKWTDERINQYFGSLIKLPKRAYNIDTGKYYRLPKPSKIKPYLLFPYYALKLPNLKKKYFDTFAKKLPSMLTEFRVDIKNIGKAMNAVEIGKTGKAKVSQPAWAIDASGIGQVVSGNACKQKINIKVIKSGKLTLNFRGIDKKDKDKKCLPLWIDYKSIKIDGKKINDKTVQTWHDKPFKYEMPVKDGQEVQLEFEQVYHKYNKAELKNVLLKLNSNSSYIKQNIDKLTDTIYQNIYPKATKSLKVASKDKTTSFKHFLYHKVKTDTYTKTYICGIRVKRKPANIYEFIDKRLSTLSKNWENKFAAVVNAGANNKKELLTKISMQQKTLKATNDEIASLSKESKLIKSNSLYMIKSLNDKMAEVMGGQAVNAQTLQIIQAENTAEILTGITKMQENGNTNRAAILEQLNRLPENIAQNSSINKKEITESIKVLGNQHQKGLDDLLNNLKQYYVSRTKTDNYSLEFRTFADMAQCIRTNLYKLPEDVDLVVGIPRSGMIPAYIIALFMNKKFCSLDEFLGGSTGSKGFRKINTEEVKNVLVIDDSVFNGREMGRTRQKLASFADKYSFIFATVYVKPDSEDKVDVWLERVATPRIWQWNYLNHGIAQKACFDMDGVLCVDPTPEENDDGEKYLEFIAKTKPLYIPTYEINAIVTSRLEKYREPTEKWLKDHGVKYKQLIMLDLPTAEERRKLGCHAKFKAEIYKNLTDTVLFVESEPNQAREIALLTGKTVICTSTDEVY